MAAFPILVLLKGSDGQDQYTGVQPIHQNNVLGRIFFEKFKIVLGVNFNEEFNGDLAFHIKGNFKIIFVFVLNGYTKYQTLLLKPYIERAENCTPKYVVRGHEKIN